MVAKKNIKCYKNGFKIRSDTDRRSVLFGSRIHDFCYQRNRPSEDVKLVVEEFTRKPTLHDIIYTPATSKLPEKVICKVINKGYHSYKSLRMALVACDYNYNVAKFVIPKGATYYENDYEYVSSDIIFKGFYTDKKLEKLGKKPFKEF